ncbi:hypothetical protein OPKNFCMD_5179 [Methylobacterium crusticola]|uniref:Ribokinase n=1 Tax=Methylobacterium crusticola TaxID=1697972 RepID=A0ABQ4R6I8_9HYPH|nr:hypothetical protein [Methylobacterium crusticola]GJD52414.1 hypothetical protein OPKNFCMD_5179 [Methylobacterium crusticola]
MLPVPLPILGLAVEHAPELIGLLSGERAGAVAQGAATAVRAVLGTADPQAARQRLAAEPALAEALAARLAAEAERHRAELAGLADARAAALARSGIAWTPVILSYLVVVASIAMTFCLFFVRAEVPERLFQLISGAYAALWLAFGAVYQFWIGSSRTSQAKDAQIGALLREPGRR